MKYVILLIATASIIGTNIYNTKIIKELHKKGIWRIIDLNSQNKFNPEFQYRFSLEKPKESTKYLTEGVHYATKVTPEHIYFYDIEQQTHATINNQDKTTLNVRNKNIYLKVKCLETLKNE